MKIAILGAGSGGCAAAAHLTLKGFNISLWNRSHTGIEQILKCGGIEITGVVEGFAKINKVTTDIKEATSGVDLVMITTPAFGHKPVAECCLPHLRDGQTVVFDSGYASALEFANTIKKFGVKKNVTIAETSILPYCCKRVGLTAHVQVNHVQEFFLFATFPGKDVGKVIDEFKQIYPAASPASNVLETSLNNPNPIVHPSGTLLNAGRIESFKGGYTFYKEGVTPSVAKLIEAVDRERLALCRALGLKEISTEERMAASGCAKKSTIQEMYNTSKALEYAMAPSDLQSRFLTEDIPYGLVTWASLGDMLDVPTPVIRSEIQLASVINQNDYWKVGRTVKELGISGLRLSELKKFLAEGRV